MDRQPLPTFAPPSLARIEVAEIIEDGQAVGLLVKETDGTVSAIRISVEQLAD